MGSPAGLGIAGLCPAGSEPLAMIKKGKKTTTPIFLIH